jgi:mono/diheme cytochrome c family protein
MHGVIEVSAAPGAAPLATDTPAPQPLYLQLGLDIDAPHPAEAGPQLPPVAARGASLAGQLPAWARSREAYLTSSPAGMWQRLRTEASLGRLSDQQLWDAVAWIWTQPAQEIQAGEEIYRSDCLACHGQEGQGDGVMLRDLSPLEDHTQMGGQLVRPPDFSDPSVLLGASPARLEGKILRGGMGTGMPYWGPILDDEQVAAVIRYLYTFAFPTAEGAAAPAATPGHLGSHGEP